MSKKVKVTLSPYARTEKPDPVTENALICSDHTWEISVEALAVAVGENGHSWCQDTFRGCRSAKNFISADLLVLDFDYDGTGESPLTFGKARQRLLEYGLDCTFAYETFSNADVQPPGTDLCEAVRYRMVFLLPQTVTDLAALEEMLYKGLYLIFPEADRLSGVQLWYGGRQLLHCNPSYVLNLADLCQAARSAGACRYASSKHRRQWLKATAQKQDELMASLGGEVSKMDSVFNIIKEEFKNGTGETIKNFDWLLAEHESRTLNDFLNCRRKFEHHELARLYMAMRKINGGKSRWREAVENNPLINNEKLDTVAFDLDERAKRGNPYSEPRLAAYAVPGDPALEKYQFLTQIGSRCGQWVQELVPPKLMPLKDAETLLNLKLTEALSKVGTARSIFRCATGLGKSKQVLEYQDLKKKVIAAPTQKVKKEHSKKLTEDGVMHFVTPELPRLPERLDNEYRRLMALGAFKEATVLLKNIVNSNGDFLRLLTQDEFRTVRPRLKKYFDQMEQCKHTDLPVVTTHKKLLLSDFPRHDTVIIDEDILPTLLEQHAVLVSDLRILIGLVSEMPAYPEKEHDLNRLARLLQTVQTVELLSVHGWDEYNIGFDTEAIKRIARITAKSHEISGNVLAMLTSDCFLVDLKKHKDVNGERKVFYLTERALPNDKKIILLSATVDEQVYRAIFGEFDWLDISHVEQVGNCRQIGPKGFSKAAMSLQENEKDLHFIVRYVGNQVVITHKRFRGNFTNPALELCLENGSGSNDYTGKAIVVIGTPHIPVASYALFAFAVGVKFTSADLKLRRQECEHKGMRFTFTTFDHPGLRHIQFYHIESALIQACGRARTLRTQGSVNLFSNFPLVGFQKTTLRALRAQWMEKPEIKAEKPSTLQDRIAEFKAHLQTPAGIKQWNDMVLKSA